MGNTRSHSTEINVESRQLQMLFAAVEHKAEGLSLGALFTLQEARGGVVG
jgi:hypothetical protein